MLPRILMLMGRCRTPRIRKSRLGARKSLLGIGALQLVRRQPALAGALIVIDQQKGLLIRRSLVRAQVGEPNSGVTSRGVAPSSFYTERLFRRYCLVLADRLGRDSFRPAWGRRAARIRGRWKSGGDHLLTVQEITEVSKAQGLRTRRHQVC